MIPLIAVVLAQVPPVSAEETVRETVEHLRLERTFAETSWVGWGLLLGAIFAGVVAGKVAQTLLRNAGRAALRRDWTAQGTALLSAAGPANLALMAVGLRLGLSALVLSPPVREFSGNVIRFLFILAIGWFCYNLVDLVDVLLRHLSATRRRHRNGTDADADEPDGADPAAVPATAPTTTTAAAPPTGSSLDEQVVPLIRKTLRIFLVVVFALFTAENVFGANITAWLAGLGIAGLAVSLAAQDSIKNLFGSITIFMDRPFMVGERIVFDGHDGPVQEIGFRSTRVRTLGGDLVTIPNSKIVDGSVQNIGRRPSIPRIFDVTITYDTPPAKVEQAVRILEEILAEPEIAAAFDLAAQPPRVGFTDLNADHLNIKVWYWFRPASDWWAYVAHAQSVNLKLMRAFADAGIEFAFPTRTLYLAGDPNRELSVRTAAVEPGDGDGRP